MEKQTTRHSNKEQQTPAPPSRPSPTTVNDIPDHLLKLIFGRLDSHVAYVRAAAVCTRWRRIASIRGVMCVDWNPHEFCTTIGHYHVVADGDDDPSSSPAGQQRRGDDDPSSSPAGQQRHRRRVASFVPASPSIDARHFTLDFLPSFPGRRRQHWEVVDGCGSLLLLVAVANNQRRRRGCLFPDDLVVCEPISRRFVRVQPAGEDMKRRRCLGVFLDRYCNVPSMCSFSLTCVLHEPSAGVADGVAAVTASVYRHQPPGWSRWKHGWSTPRLATSGGSVVVHLRAGAAESARYAGRSKGFIFWSIHNQDDGGGGGGAVVVVSAREGSGVLSRFRLPEHVVRGGGEGGPQHRFRFVDGGGGGADNNNYDDNLVRVVSLVGNDELRVFVKVEQELANGGGRVVVDWVPVRSLNLREATRGLPGFKECFFRHPTAKIVTAGTGYVVLTPAEETWLFSVELRTMKAEREHVRNRLAGEVYPYELRLRPTVRACVRSCKRGRNGPCFHICRCK